MRQSWKIWTMATDSVHCRFWKSLPLLISQTSTWYLSCADCHVFGIFGVNLQNKNMLRNCCPDSPASNVWEFIIPVFSSFVLLEEGQIKRGLHMRVWSSLVQREEPRQYEMERKVWVEKWMKGHKGEGIRQGHRCDITLVIGMAGGKCVNIPFWEGLSPNWLAHLSVKIFYYQYQLPISTRYCFKWTSY